MADLQQPKSGGPNASIALPRPYLAFGSWAGPALALLGAVSVALIQYRAGWDAIGAEIAFALLAAGAAAGLLGRQASRAAGALEISRQALASENAALAERATALLHQEQLFDSVLDCMTEAVVVVDADLRPLKLNPIARAGFERDQTSFENWITFAELEIVEHRKGVPFDPADAPIRRALRGESIDRLRLRGQAGEQWYEASARPVRGDDGAIRGALLVYRDMVDTVGAEHGRALLASVFESAPDALMSADLQGRITSWNPGAERLFGYSGDEAIGRSIEMLMAPEYPWVLTELAERKELGQHDTRLFGKDSTSIDVSISASPIEMRGRIVGFAIVCRDNTIRKRAEEDLQRARDLAIEAARLRSEFLANMSHEIRTPLNGIVGTTELMSDTGLTEEQREYTQTITVSGKLLLSIVDDILDFSKLAAGKVTFERIGFDLHEVIEATIESFSEPAYQKRIELLCTIASDVPQFIIGDPTRLRQVLNNLVGNAVKFTAGGEVAVSVGNLNSGGGAENASTANLRFEVRDTGIGVAPEARQWLFQPFSQADGSTSRKFGGTGLGLAISARLVEGMGGRIEVASEPGAGATFFFTLPLCVQNRPAAEPANPAILRGLRALVVDDNATNRIIVSSQLESWGVAADSAAGGTEALVAMRQRAAAGRPFDLVITDMHMPGLDGLTLARAIRSDPRLSATRIVVMSSLSSKPSRSTGHVDLWINKPLMPPRLLARLCALFTADAAASAPPAPPAPESDPEETATSAAEPVFKGDRILVIEDNSINRRLALLQLRRLGYASEAVGDARAALEMAGRESFVMILMDCELPGVDGYHATREIRRREGSLKHTVIVAMTAHAIEGARERCLEAGMDDYIAKPITLGRLKALLERWIHPKAELPLIAAGARLSNHEDSASIDESVGNKLRALGRGDQQVMRDVIGVYQDELPERLRKMHQMLDGGDSEALAVESHSLRSVCSEMGFIRMTRLCADLEQFASARNLVSARAMLELLEHECGLARPQLDDMRTGRNVT